MSAFTAEQRAELRAAMDESAREAARLSLARAAGPGTEAATLADLMAASAADPHTETVGIAVEVSPGPASLADRELLLLAEAQPVILRVAAATDADFPGRVAHIARVAARAVRSKLQPCNAFAAPTLLPPENATGLRGSLDGHRAGQKGQAQ